MKKYCRAYLLADLREFRDWPASVLAEGAALQDTDVVYLCDDHTVVIRPVLADKGVIWDSITEDWIRFCATELGFDPGTADQDAVDEPATVGS